MKDLGSMNAAELKEELKREKALLKELERDAFLSKCQIEHLEACIKASERGQNEN